MGIENIKEARTPHYTTRPDLERAGMGLTIIDSLSDSFSITEYSGASFPNHFIGPTFTCSPPFTVTGNLNSWLV